MLLNVKTGFNGVRQRPDDEFATFVSSLTKLRADGVRSIALPPPGSGNGGLDREDVRPQIVETPGALATAEVIAYEPPRQCQNVSKRAGVEKLTPARALVVELACPYWILSMACTLREIHNIACISEQYVVDELTHRLIVAGIDWSAGQQECSI
jgi:hypothetical protein